MCGSSRGVYSRRDLTYEGGYDAKLPAPPRNMRLAGIVFDVISKIQSKFQLMQLHNILSPLSYFPLYLKKIVKTKGLRNFIQT